MANISVFYFFDYVNPDSAEKWQFHRKRAPFYLENSCRRRLQTAMESGSGEPFHRNK